MAAARRPGRFARRLLLVAAAGLGLRLAYLFTIAPDLERGTGALFGLGDWFYYHEQANLIAAGEGFATPFADRPDPAADHPPLWPLTLAAVSALGGTGWTAHRVATCLIGAAVVVLVGLLGRRAAGERVGLLAAALGAAYPVLIGADGSLMSETLYGLLVLAALLLAWRLAERPGTAAALALGAVIGLAALTRTEALLLLVLLVPAVAWRGGGPLRARAGRAALAALACAAALAPWTLRNQAVFGEPILVSTTAAGVLAGANCPTTYHGGNVGGWDVRCLSLTPERNDAVNEDRWRREGRRYLLDHLGELPRVMAFRVLRTWDLHQPRAHAAFAVDRHLRVEQAGVLAFYALVPLAVAGALLLRRRGVPLLVLVVPVVLVTVSSAAGYGSPRFRHAAEFSLLVLAAVALEALAARRRARAERRRGGEESPPQRPARDAAAVSLRAPGPGGAPRTII